MEYPTKLREELERAAKRLGIAQPGLSQQIMSLETIVGHSLIDHSRRAVALTLTGHLLHEEARKVVEQADNAMLALCRFGRDESGRISIGYVASAAYSGILTRSLATFKANCPDTDLHLLEMEMHQQLIRIKEGELHFGYVRAPALVAPELSMIIVLRERLVVALSDGHPMSLSSSLDIADLADFTFITPRQPPDVGFHANAIAACGDAGYHPKIAATGRDFTTTISMVAVGLGISLVPESLKCMKMPGVGYSTVFNCTITSDLAIAYRKSETSSVVRAFIAHHKLLAESAS